MLFDINLSDGEIMDLDGDLYVVTGRVPFGDDDTSVLIQAAGESQAIEGFRVHMRDMHPDYKEPDSDDLFDEPDVYINETMHIGTLHKDQ